MADATAPFQPADPSRRNRRVAVMLAGVAAGMVGLAFASVPLYQLFCQVTGFGGTTQVAADNPKGVITREMKVRFDVNVDRALNWTVTPAAPITDQIGKVDTVNYIATNHSDKPVTGQAMSYPKRPASTSTRSSASALPSRPCSRVKRWKCPSSSSSIPISTKTTNSIPSKRTRSLIPSTLQTVREAEHGRH